MTLLENHVGKVGISGDVGMFYIASTKILGLSISVMC